MFKSATVRLIPQGRIITRVFSSQSSTKKSDGSSAVNPNVQGLSENCVKVPNHPVGPGASKDKEYKTPEYFCFTAFSFAEAEVEMEKYRLPAPSSKAKHTK
ncbi:uncharacterized protein LOC122508992 [Leptopilina heterotoma]|uniref:uncharacterized protein LOC122508992 n=1 Tax=Leptopilina heterotoma TaxID=63436 RepID=UPI001CA9B35B|nr:uncharacterized protein LOC122508992 [Leptopilina heterotoma]